MITAQDIREKTFEKSVRGYAMDEVDDFLDELASDLAASQKETATLRSKMKVLVDKIEEYRENEDAMHLALVTAQKVAKNITDDSQSQADDLISSAQAKADEILSAAKAEAEEMLSAAHAEVAAITGSIVQQREVEERRLHTAQVAAADYIQRFRAVLEHEKTFLDSLEDSDFVPDVIVTPAPVEPKAIAAPVEEPAEEPEYAEYAEAAEVEPEAAEPANEMPSLERLFEQAVFAGMESDDDTIPEAEDGDDVPSFRF